MAQVIILGAGGHGQVVADILLSCAQIQGSAVPVGYLDDSPLLQGKERLGLPILGRIADLRRVPHDGVIVAIGDNRRRRDLFEQLSLEGERVVRAIHPSAIVAADARIGPGTVVAAGAVAATGSVVGQNAILNTGCTVDHNCQVGNHAHVAPGCHLGGDVRIGEGTLLGIGSVILPQRLVGEWSVVGAGAVVNRDVGPRIVVVGVPARAIGCRHASGSHGEEITAVRSGGDCAR